MTWRPQTYLLIVVIIMFIALFVEASLLILTIYHALIALVGHLNTIIRVIVGP